jgi:hypothetical protein
MMANCHRTVTVSTCGGRPRDGVFEEPWKGDPLMSLESHLEELKRKHNDLSREIDQALLHPSVDDLEIVRLKRRKLAIKDEMEQLRTTTH